MGQVDTAANGGGIMLAGGYTAFKKYIRNTGGLI
jgi:hypothetical protein